MNGKDFFELLGGLDEDIVEDAWMLDENILEDAWTKEGEAVMIEERRPFPLWRTTLFTAAAICILAAGIFGGLKLHGIQSAGSGPEVSMSSSDISDSFASIADKLNSEINEINRIEKMNSVIINGHEFNTIRLDPESDIIYTDPVTVTDDSNFAALYIAFQNTSEHFTMHIMIDRKDYLYENGKYMLGKYKLTHLGEIIVSENKEGTYLIDYTESAAAGDELVLGFYTTNDHITVDGKWLP